MRVSPKKLTIISKCKNCHSEHENVIINFQLIKFDEKTNLKNTGADVEIIERWCNPNLIVS